MEFLARRGRAILGDDMGLGKTRQAIIAMKEAARATGQEGVRLDMIGESEELITSARRRFPRRCARMTFRALGNPEAATPWCVTAMLVHSSFGMTAASTQS